jgi:predicted ArsR family transcriptional regulator
MSGEEVSAASAAIAAVATLDDPTRRSIYGYVAAHGAPVGREEVATAVGVAHHVARFHLDRLQEAGLLQVEYRRPPGRGGPGAGHPTKLYSPTPTEFAVSVPERRYDLAGLVLSRAVATAIQEGTPIGQALEEAAGHAGRALGQQARHHGAETRRQHVALATALATLDAHGFSPRADDGGYVLGNCPFRVLAQEQPDVVCGMNLALVSSLLAEVGARSATARLDPACGRCCITIHS